MVDKNAFLKAYNIDEEDFKAADISWEELAAIYDDYLSIEEKLRGSVKTFVNDYLYDIERAGIPFLPLPYQKSRTPFRENHTKTERRSREI